MMMMTPIPAASIIGRHVTLNEQAGEGWFAGYAAVTGIIKSVIQPRRGDNSYYVVQFDSPLELQETGAATPSGFILRRYSHCVIHCRWEGFDINFDSPVSVHVMLVPAGTGIPNSTAELVGMQIRKWGMCIVSNNNRS
jgi:hypothetical protein